MHDTPSCYPELLKPATMTEEDLRSTAKWRRKALLARVPKMSPEHVKHLIETSDDELARGVLDGPFFSEEEVTNQLG